MKNIFQQKVSETIWKETYKWETDKTIEDTFKRVAKTLASVEEDRKKWEKEFYNLINNFKFVLGGRIFSNAGTKLKGTCMVNCFVSGFNGKDQDSMEGIFTELYRQAKILKSEGGYGCNFDVLRPDGNFVKGIGVESCGAVQWMSAWNGISKIVTKGSSSRKQKEIQVGKNKIRKGAMMGNMSVWHPDIFNFIKVKQEKGKLELFNLSVLLTDKFMSAVKNKKNWDLIFPDTTYSKYDSEWDGNIEKWISKKYPIKVWDTVKAVDLWDLIIECNYNKGEPGVLFIDRINDLNNLYYCEEIYGTNPCGEEPLPINGACVLGSINLTQYIREDKTDLDYNKLEKDIPTMVRMLDNVIDVTNYPLLEQKKEELSKRRIGIGYLGYASTLHILGIAYGSSKALKITKELVQYVTNNLYRASALLADVKGIFPLYREKEYLKSLFIQKTLSTETTNLIKKHGIRNSHLTTIAPTGTISILANNVSSGIEPVIHTSYMRTFMESNPPEDLILPTEIDWIHQQYKSENGWKWELEGDQYILKKKFKNVIYKLYEDRGLCREEEVYDYGYINIKDKFDADKEKAEDEEKEFYGKTIFDLTVDDHIKTLA